MGTPRGNSGSVVVPVERGFVISHLIARTLAKLRPNGAELYRLVKMETDPACAQRFEQLTPGPVPAALGLLLIGVYGIFAAPVRLLRRDD